MEEIDVSKCMYKTNEINGCNWENKNHSIEFMECKDSNCYYKQLKRKEKECEELKNRIDSLQVDKWAEEDAPTIKEEKYYQALQEIKRIIDDNTEPGTITTASKLCEMLNGIYKKISEVEE